MRAATESDDQTRNERTSNRIGRREWVPRSEIRNPNSNANREISNPVVSNPNPDTDPFPVSAELNSNQETLIRTNGNGVISNLVVSNPNPVADRFTVSTEPNSNQETRIRVTASIPEPETLIRVTASSPEPETLIQGRNRPNPETVIGVDIQGNNRYNRGRQRVNFVRRCYAGQNSSARIGNRDAKQINVEISKANRDPDSSTGSNVPQLVQEIQEKLIKSTVECMICYDMVRRTAPIWSCESCFSIFHLHCIKKWARAPTSVDLLAEKNQGSNWRCPGCQSVQLVSSKEIRYSCFCGRRQEPPSDFYLTPHSCGEPCGKPLERGTQDTVNSCPHLCVLQCHPGPCPPCKAFAPPQQCPCGKKMITRRCSDQKSVLSCGQPCDKLLECGRHRCEEICHVGSCDPCKVLCEASCFCQKKTERILCGEMGIKGEIEGSNGAFSCNSKCAKILDCRNHSCSKNCHPGDCGGCEFRPGRIKTCHCGKTQLKKERLSCLDPIPTCSQVCGKFLPCGNHSCRETCHEGDCPPCLVLVEEKCRCGSSSRTVECYRTVSPVEVSLFLCDRPCGQKKNCGRHRCSERCCPLLNSMNSQRFEGDWDPHLCSVVCGKKLRCGQHICEALCHSGHCMPCLETIFFDLTCACGKTSIPPPLPCGTPPPSCQNSCSVPQPCGHSASHSCHFGDCPPCSIPVVKECIGGHVLMRNIPCGSRDIRCNQLCGKTRQCGMHACARTCHPPPCDAPLPGGSTYSKNSCGQVCGAPRRDCRHTCVSSCHPSTQCPDLRCEFPVTITCSCGRISATVPCDAGVNNNVHVDSVLEASVIHQLPTPLQPVEATSRRMPLGQRKLACDEDCAKLERKKVLADAFDINTSVDALHFGENSVVSDLLSDLFRREPKWVLAIEERFKYMVLGKYKGTANSIRVHVFCAAQKEKRDAIRQMAERWKLSVSAAGWEPRRFLVVHVTQKSKAPARILGSKGSVSVFGLTPPAFDPAIDMDPRLVVAFLDLPRDADISALVLRFGGECELVWLNDKNALAVFGDPVRAATALRRLDYGSPYHGAVVVVQNAGGTSAWGAKEGGGILKGNAWKKAAQDTGWSDDSWGGDRSGAEVLKQSMKGVEAPIVASKNPWRVLDPDSVSNSTTSSAGAQDLMAHQMEGSSGVSGRPPAGQSGMNDQSGNLTEVDDWEEAYA